MTAIGGYFDADALAQLQQAYADKMLTPEEQDVDQLTGLPTETISNTSPWAGELPLWQYPDGKNPLETAPIMFNAGADDEEEIVEEPLEAEDDDYVSPMDDTEMSEEEINARMGELLSPDDFENEGEDTEYDLEGISDEEFDAMMEEILQEILSEEE